MSRLVVDLFPGPPNAFAIALSAGKMAITNPPTPEGECPPSREEFQFGLQAFLWMFLVVAVFLSYIRTFRPEAVAVFAFVATLSLLIGGAIGLLAGRFSAAVFWAGIGAVGGYLAVVHTCLYHWTQEYAWPLMAVIVGATAAACGDGNPRRRIVWSALVWLGLIAIYDLSLFGLDRDLMADPICAVVAGALFGLGVDLATRFEKHTRVPRHFFALGLVIVAIGGHWLAIRLVPGV
jgi:hypothetical protein